MKIHDYGKWTLIALWKDDLSIEQVFWYKGHLAWSTAKSMFDKSQAIDVRYYLNGQDTDPTGY